MWLRREIVDGKGWSGMGQLREEKEEGLDKMDGDHQAKDDGYCGDRGKNRSLRGGRRLRE